MWDRGVLEGVGIRGGIGTKFEMRWMEGGSGNCVGRAPGLWDLEIQGFGSLGIQGIPEWPHPGFCEMFEFLVEPL